MSQRALFIQIENTNVSLLIKNCSFTYITYTPQFIEQVVYGMLSVVNVIVKFENCKFHYNVVSVQLQLDFGSSDGLCVHPSNVTIENCEFIGNYGNLINLHNLVHHCKTNVLFNGTNNFTKNNEGSVLYFTYMAVVMKGMILVSENKELGIFFHLIFATLLLLIKLFFFPTYVNL